MIEASTCVAIMAKKKALAVNHKVDQCSRFSEQAEWQKILHGQLYIIDCKDEGNTQKPYLPEKKTVVVLKTLVLERAWVPCMVSRQRIF